MVHVQNPRKALNLILLVYHLYIPGIYVGVYQHTGGQLLGGHAIRILGWGTENNTPYWLVANSWNTDWGDNGTSKDALMVLGHLVKFFIITLGYFKIIRGRNEVGIEDGIYAGQPKK